MNGQHNIAPLIRKQSSLAQVFLIREDSKQCCHLRIDEERRKNSTHSDSTVGNRFRSNFRCIIKLNAEKTAEQKSHLVIRTPSRGGLRGKSCSRALWELRTPRQILEDTFESCVRPTSTPLSTQITLELLHHWINPLLIKTPIHRVLRNPSRSQITSHQIKKK